MPGNRVLELLGGIPFGAASFVRGKRIFHPRGSAFRADLDIDDEGLGQLLAPRSRGLVTVRLSNGAGLPAPFPDVRGFAMRIHDAHGRGRHQDLALATGARAVGLRNVLLPARDLSTSFFSSILPYEVAGKILLFGAAPHPGARWSFHEELGAEVARSTVTFDLLTAGIVGGWTRLGRVRLVEELSQRRSTEVRFNPPRNTGPRVRALGVLNALRDPAYRWSQVARRVRGDSTDVPIHGRVPAPRGEHIPLSG